MCGALCGCVCFAFAYAVSWKWIFRLHSAFTPATICNSKMWALWFFTAFALLPISPIQSKSLNLPLFLSRAFREWFCTLSHFHSINMHIHQGWWAELSWENNASRAKKIPFLIAYSVGFPCRLAASRTNWYSIFDFFPLSICIFCVDVLLSDFLTVHYSCSRANQWNISSVSFVRTRHLILFNQRMISCCCTAD